MQTIEAVRSAQSSRGGVSAGQSRGAQRNSHEVREAEDAQRRHDKEMLKLQEAQTHERQDEVRAYPETRKPETGNRKPGNRTSARTRWAPAQACLQRPQSFWSHRFGRVFCSKVDGVVPGSDYVDLGRGRAAKTRDEEKLKLQEAQTHERQDEVRANPETKPEIGNREPGTGNREPGTGSRTSARMGSVQV
ncbi:hypothetical protein T484DRAFT_2160452 [Baffinella frigidus]|nr:hypothetical protein T484DRAFT_2160452 [Cryptophyta sp. CCMP2293]